MSNVIILLLGIATGLSILAWYLERTSRLKAEQDRSTILSQKKSSETRLGQISEQLAPFLNVFHHDPKKARFIGQPIDFIVFEDDRIVFVEVKSGESRLSEKQSNIKQLVLNKKIEWEDIRINGIAQTPSQSPAEVPITQIKLSDILTKERVILGLQVESKNDLLTQLSEILSKSSNVLDKKEINAAILEREAQMTTGVGKGYAIPHGRTNSVLGFVAALVILKNEIDFNALDEKPVKIVFAFVGNNMSAQAHIKLLAQVAHKLDNQDFRDQLLAAKTTEEALSIFTKP